MEKKEQEAFCGFCGKSQREVRHIYQAKTKEVYVCTDCLVYMVEDMIIRNGAEIVEKVKQNIL